MFNVVSIARATQESLDILDKVAVDILGDCTTDKDLKNTIAAMQINVERMGKYFRNRTRKEKEFAIATTINFIALFTDSDELTYTRFFNALNTLMDYAYPREVRG